MQHEPAKLREYLVAGVEDPRINLQSILSRHFLLRSLFGDKYRELKDQECRFAAVMNWFTALVANSDSEELDVISHALQLGADNAEGIQIPRFIVKAFGSLPVSFGPLEIPNYIEAYLDRARKVSLSSSDRGKGSIAPESPSPLDTFQNLWRQALATEAAPGPLPTVFEPACGSANDYRFLHSYGIARFLDYTGFDLCSKNVENARALFPVTPTLLSASGEQVRFEHGNIFEIHAQDNAFELSFVHDLFEHLSVEGLHAGAKELCRVTRRAICANFFQMDEIPEHVIRPTDEYHWNLLSMDQVKKSFAGHGFSGQVIRIKSFLRQEFGCDYTHNPNAYTFVLHRA